MYWACQTLTTVGYGDFGAYNNWEMAITCVWMFCGVAIYTVVVGVLTSMVESTAIKDVQEVLTGQLEEYSINCGLDDNLYQECVMFI
jgi:hypothetical protein